MKIDKRINVDVVRFICTLFVVAIHVYPFTFLGESTDYLVTRVLFRIAVPFFLMVTGYYLLPKALEDKKKLTSYTKKITLLYLESILLYLPIMYYNGYFKEVNMISMLQDIFIDGTFYHLWYFPALLLGIWITYFLLKKWQIKQVGFLVFLLYCVGVFGDAYYGIIQNISIFKYFYGIIFTVSSYTRNGLFYVPIFLLIGYLVKKKQNKSGFGKTLLLMVISTFLLLFEGSILYVNEIPRHSSMYFSLLPLSFFAFSLVMENTRGSNQFLRILSSWVYILHPLFITLVHFMAKRISFLNHSLVNYIAVLVLTIGFIFILKVVKEVVKHGRGFSNG